MIPSTSQTLTLSDLEKIKSEFSDEHKQFLPHLLQDIWTHCGRNAAFDLWFVYSEETLYIPCKVIDSHPIYELIGQKAMESLTFHWGGVTLLLPKASFLRDYLRNKKIIQLFIENNSCRKISTQLKAEGVRVSKRGVQYIVEKYSKIF